MARTPSGKLTGRAAATELREQREMLEEEVQKQVEELYAESGGIRMCIHLEGEPSFYRWWNDDALVPPTASRAERIKLLKERIESLEHAKSLQANSESV